MKNGVKRFYRVFNYKPGPNYFVFDRKTGEKIHESSDKEKADDIVNEKNAEDAKARGIELNEVVETPSHYFGSRNGIAREIAPMVRHGAKSPTVQTELEQGATVD